MASNQGDVLLRAARAMTKRRRGALLARTKTGRSHVLAAWVQALRQAESEAHGGRSS